MAAPALLMELWLRSDSKTLRRIICENKLMLAKSFVIEVKSA